MLGFVMLLVGWNLGVCGIKGVVVVDVIVGNLCWCMGYGLILDVGEVVLVGVCDDGVMVDMLCSIFVVWFGEGWFVLVILDDLVVVLVVYFEVWIVVGGIDVGLWVMK